LDTWSFEEETEHVEITIEFVLRELVFEIFRKEKFD